MSNTDGGKITVFNSVLPNNSDAVKLVAELGKMLFMAEGLFGPRESWRSIEGIEFWRNDPDIYYPSGDSSPEIIIRLRSTSCFDSACYELAHETVHLLAPIRIGDVTNLEEGAACYFATHYMKEQLGQEWSIKKPADDATPTERERYYAYKQALNVVTTQLEKHRGGLVKLRTPWRRFGDIRPEELQGAFAELNLSDAEFLANPFGQN